MYLSLCVSLCLYGYLQRILDAKGIYIHACVFIDTYIRTYIYMNTNLFIYMYICACMYMHMSVSMCIYIHRNITSPKWVILLGPSPKTLPLQ